MRYRLLSSDNSVVVNHLSYVVKGGEHVLATLISSGFEGGVLPMATCYRGLEPRPTGSCYTGYNPLPGYYCKMGAYKAELR